MVNFRNGCLQMVCSFETVTEEMWSAAVDQLRGKQEGTRVLVWVNYDLIALHKIFYMVEKGVGRIVLRDFPLPVFWDEEIPKVATRIQKLHQAIHSFTFSDLPPFAVSARDEEDEWDTWGTSVSGSVLDSEDSKSLVESIVTEDSLSSIESSEAEFTEEEAFERLQCQIALYRKEEEESKNEF